MNAWLISVAVLAFILALVWLARRARGKPFRLPRPEEWALSGSGLDLRGIRYRNVGFPPVVLIHGYAGNSRNWREMGYTLFRAGFDVWMPNLRGHGKGSHRSTFHGGVDAYAFERIPVEDVPRIVDHVTGSTGRKVSIFAHSMGGIAARAYLSGVVAEGKGFRVDEGRAARLSRDKVTSLALFGSPPHFHNCSAAIKFLLKQPRPLVEVLHQGLPIPDPHRAPTAPDEKARFAWIRQSAFARLVGGIVANPVVRGIVNVANFDATTMELPRLLQKGVSKVNVELIHDVRRWMSEGDVRSRGGFDFSETRPLYVPVLFVAGDMDGLAPWEDVMKAADAYSAHTNVWKILVHRTSHVDLIAGDRAARILGPFLVKFLRDPTALGAVGTKIEL